MELIVFVRFKLDSHFPRAQILAYDVNVRLMWLFDVSIGFLRFIETKCDRSMSKIEA